MNDLFRDQLLKAGLATKKQAKAAAHEENVSRRKRRKDHAGPANEETPEQVAAREAIEAKRERDRQLNLEREAAQQAQARHAQSDDLIRQHRIRDFKGTIEYKFPDEGKVKTLLVTREIQKGLGGGELGIVWGEGGYHLVPREAAERIEERTPDRLVLLFDKDGGADPEDPYAVPDDLMW